MSKRYLILALASALRVMAQSCPANATQQAAAQAMKLQQQLLAASIPDADTDVPAPLRPLIHDFKQSLITTVDEALLCNNPESARLQSDLARLLHANRPPKPDPAYDPSYKLGSHSGIYGDGLTVSVKPVLHQPNLYSIQLSYEIECGEDNILLLYRRTPTGYQREFLWQNPDLNTVGDALGDFFFSTFVPAPIPAVAVMYGFPWCSSNMSSIRIDLVALGTAKIPQHLLDHAELIYYRDEPIHLHTEDDGFELLATIDSIDESQLRRKAILRFYTSTGKLIQRQPIARDASGFVDGWLMAPWPQASQWSDPGALGALGEAYKRLRTPDSQTDEFQFVDLGPVRACSMPTSTFQVEIDRSGGKDLGQGKFSYFDLPTFYARVRRSPVGYTMRSITTHADPTCTRPDTMKPRR